MNTTRETRHSDHPPSRPRPFSSHIWALMVLLGSVILVCMLWRVAYNRELRAAELAFVSSTDEVVELLKQRMAQYELVTSGGASLFASVARPTPRHWYSYVDGMDIRNRFTAMVGLGFAGYVSQSRLADLQREWRDLGWGQLEVRPRGARRHYGPILYLEPRTPENVEATGYDMFSEPARNAAMQRALESGRPALSAPVHLVQDQRADAIGLLLYMPVYTGGGRPTSLAARREGMLGWVYVPFRVEPFVRDALGQAHRDMGLRIHDVGPSGEQLLFNSIDAASPAIPAFHHQVALEHYGRRWRIEFQSKPMAAAAPRLASLQTILALGLFASLLMYAIAWMLARTESRAQRIALQLTEDFRRSEMRFRTAMEHSPIGKALLDSNGIVVEANVALGLIVGRTAQSLMGVRLESLFQDDSTAATWYANTGAHGVQRTTRRLHRQGGPGHAQLTYATLPGNVGQDIVSLVQVEDVTERLRAEAQVYALNRTLEARVVARTRELSLANQELESFAYTVSHDLRAPLRGIDGFSRILIERYSGVLDEVGQGYLARVRKAAGRMGELIDALLKMSRLTRGELKRERVDLTRMASEVLDELRAGDSAHDAQARIAPGLQVEGDAVLLRNLLGNLLGNAWKFTCGRDAPWIEFGMQAGSHPSEFFIRDNGVGFAQEYVDKLFRPFQRLHDENDFAGHGIGLASVKRIVERHGGAIRAEGREGEGATFYFTLADDASPS